MNTPIVIVGCGGHGREVLGIVRAINATTAESPRWQVVGFVDDKPTEENLERVHRLGLPYLGETSWLGQAPAGTHHVIGIGDPRVRAAVDRRVAEYGTPAAVLAHPAATIGEETVLGAGVVVFAGARITTNVRLGRHVHVNQNATVAHDCVLHDGVSVNPLAAVSGGCLLEAGVLIGASAVVLQGLRVGTRAVVGAGACVVRDVPAGVVVKGVPAR